GRRLVAERQLNGLHIVQINIVYSNQHGFFVRVLGFVLFGVLACREVMRRPANLIFASSTPLTVAIRSLWGRLFKRIPYVLEVRDLWPDLPIAMGIIRN